MTEEKLMRALMISSSANLNYTKLLPSFRTDRLHSAETQNQNTKEISLNRFYTHVLNRGLGVKSPLD